MAHARLLVPGLLLAALLVYAVRTRPAEHQADVRHCTETSLAAAGLGSVSVGADAGEIRLTGSVVGDVERNRAEAAALQCGARVVVNELTTPTRGPYTTMVCVQPGRLEITGVVPDRARRGELLTVATERLGDVSVSTRLTVRPGAPSGYGRMVRTAFEEAPQLEEGCVELVDRRIEVRGRVRSPEVRDRLIARLEGAAGAEFALTSDLSVPHLSEEALGCQDAFDALLDPGAHILFAPGGAELHDDGRVLLDGVQRIWADCRAATLLVVGHTDSMGDGAENRSLSLRRAQAVLEYLVGTGMDRERLQARGLGEAQPRASNDTEAGRAANRRIELRVLGDQM